MEIATLALLHPRRVQIAFGHGVEAEAGADAVVLVPAGPDPAAQAARFAAEVLPRLA
jgi:hypothetical protein